MARHNHQLTSAQRGLGYAHRRLRARLLPDAWGKPCPRCGQPMLQGQRLDLDHVDQPRALGGKAGTGRMAHEHCNRSAGSQLGNALRRAAKTPPRRAQSRRW